MSLNDPDLAMRKSVLFLSCLALVACDAVEFDNALPEGLALAEAGEGPRVVFDLDAKPLPEIPFPNDVATRVDPDSPTGRRVNISTEAHTRAESIIRANANKLDGFATYGPLTVSFDALVDVIDLWNRHQGPDTSDDAVFVLNIDPESEGFGELVPLDVGSGRFPITLARPDKYHDNDYRRGESNLLFETVDEDINRNGRMDPGEDTDFDGVLDKPNVFPGGTDTVDDLMSFYELETNTLIVRPIFPMRERTTYAVVLTKRITDTEGNPVRSPFTYIHHTRQTEALSPLAEVLEPQGLSMDDVAFAWTFTTQTVATDLLTLRKGIGGQGPLAWIDQEFPAKVHEVHDWRGDGSPYPRHIVYGEQLGGVAGLILPFVFDEDEVPEQSVDATVESFQSIDYFVSGTFESPNFLVDDEGLAAPNNPNDHDELFRINYKTGEAVYDRGVVSFMCAIPRQELNPNPGQPFPVAIYGHGFTSMRFEQIAFAPLVARAGIATCTLDAVAHGLALPPELANDPIIPGILNQFGLPNAITVLVTGRARDLNADGVPDPGADYWTTNTFHTRDALRQSVLDMMMMTRFLRGFDGTRTWKLTDENGGVLLDGLAGDFNGDGQVDIGGPNNDYFAWGTSLGAIMSSVLAAIEPSVVAAAPVVGGAGLLEIGQRTDLGGVVRPLFLGLMGPLVVSRPLGEGRVRLEFQVATATDDINLPFAELGPEDFAPGDRVRLTNLRSDEHAEVLVTEDLRVRLAVAADAIKAPEKQSILTSEGLMDLSKKVKHTFEGTELFQRGWADPMRVEIYGLGGNLKRTISTWELEDPVEFEGAFFGPGSLLVAPAEGLGYKRQTPDMRRFLGIGQTIIEPADPANYAYRYQNPFEELTEIDPTRDPARHVLVVGALGDKTVPVSSQINMARVAGYIGQDIDPDYGKSEDQVLIDNYVCEGLDRLQRFGPDTSPLYDPDDLDRNQDGYDAPSPDPPLRATVTLPDGGQGGLRLPYIRPEGEHGFRLQSPHKDFDIDTFMNNQIAWYFQRRGMEIIDDICLEDNSCEFIPELPPARDL